MRLLYLLDVMDLSLVPFAELIKEAESRCTCFVMAHSEPKDDKQMLYFNYGKGAWYEACLLTNILNNDVLNNWNGELRTLQRINEEKEN